MRRPVRTVSSSPPFSGRAVPVERIFRAGRREPVEEQIVADRKDEHAERGGKENHHGMGAAFGLTKTPIDTSNMTMPATNRKPVKARNAQATK